MKRKLLIVLALVLIVPGLLMTTACSTSKKKTDSDKGPLSQPKDPKNKSEVVKRDGDTTPTTPMDEKTRRFVNEDVYYAFDSSTLDAAAQGVLKSKAEYMLTNSNAAITIEGHCDERGTSEYNMALGQRRADSAKKYLTNMGVSASRMNTVSFGKERPVEPGHNEAAWSKNRRAHFVPNN